MSSISTPGRRPRRLLSAPSSRHRSDAHAPVAAVVGLTVVAAVLRFVYLGHQGLWYDESFTAFLVRLSPGRMIGLIPHTESTPPLYYCVAWIWSRIFGDGATGLRSLSAIAGVAVVPLAYAAASELLGSRRAGLMCATLAAFNPFLWWYSQEARSYELLTALTALSLLTFARVRNEPTRGRALAWALAGGLALATHYFAAVLVVPEAIVLLAGRPRPRAVLAAVGFVAACGVALVPLAISQNGTGNDHWIAHAPLGVRLGQILPQFLIGTGAPERIALKFVAFALALCGLALIGSAAPQVRRGALLAGGLALAGFAISLVLIAFGFDDVITRNLIELWVPAAVCASAGLGADRWPRLGALITAALCAIGLIAIIGVDTNVRLQRPQWPRLAARLGRLPAGQARAILIQREGTTLPLSLYLPHIRRLFGPQRVSSVDIITMTSPSVGLCWWGAQCNLIPSAFQRSYHLAGFTPAGGFTVSQFRVHILRADHPVALSRAEVKRGLTLTKIHHDVLMIQH